MNILIRITTDELSNAFYMNDDCLSTRDMLKVMQSFGRTLQTILKSKRFSKSTFYTLLDECINDLMESDEISLTELDEMDYDSFMEEDGYCFVNFECFFSERELNVFSNFIEESYDFYDDTVEYSENTSLVDFYSDGYYDAPFAEFEKIYHEITSEGTYQWVKDGVLLTVKGSSEEDY